MNKLNISQKQLEDIEYAKVVIEMVNEKQKTHYILLDELDVKRKGGSTPPQPEAIFQDKKTFKKAVVEIKTFAYTLDDFEKAYVNKIKKIYKWVGNCLNNIPVHKFLNPHYMVCIHIKKHKINPDIVIRNLEKKFNNNDYEDEYIKIDITLLLPGDSYTLPNDWISDLGQGPSGIINYEDTSFSHLLIYTFADDAQGITELESSEIGIKYELFADKLFSRWIEDKWDNKFENYMIEEKILFIDIDFRTQYGVPHIHEQNILKDFSSVVSRKYKENFEKGIVSKIDTLVLYSCDIKYCIFLNNSINV